LAHFVFHDFVDRLSHHRKIETLHATNFGGRSETRNYLDQFGQDLCIQFGSIRHIFDGARPKDPIRSLRVGHLCHSRVEQLGSYGWITCPIETRVVRTVVVHLLALSLARQRVRTLASCRRRNHGVKKKFPRQQTRPKGFFRLSCWKCRKKISNEEKKFRTNKKKLKKKKEKKRIDEFLFVKFFFLVYCMYCFRVRSQLQMSILPHF
jgi:hypothetical protein